MNFDLVVAGVGGQGVLSIAWVLDHAARGAGSHAAHEAAWLHRHRPALTAPHGAA
jgi:Pyruvate/2-oxoacid:ferredoxin oxidoreductase gamma subunit